MSIRPPRKVSRRLMMPMRPQDPTESHGDHWRERASRARISRAVDAERDAGDDRHADGDGDDEHVLAGDADDVRDHAGRLAAATNWRTKSARPAR